MYTDKQTVRLEVAPLYDQVWDFGLEIDEEGGIFQERWFGYEYIVKDKEETKFHKICFSKFYEVFPRQVGAWIMRELEYYASHNPAKVDYEEENYAHHDRA